MKIFLPFVIRDQVEQKIQELLRLDVTEPIQSSEWLSPLVVVEKKNNDRRVCVDLRRVNEAIVADTFPLPHIEDLFAELRDAVYFTKLDLNSAYHQVELAEESRDLTAFVTQSGVFRYKRICFGLASAPLAFQAIMKDALDGIPGVLVYLDDILVVGSSRSQHDRRLCEVLSRIRDVGMTLNEKCVIGVP